MCYKLCGYSYTVREALKQAILNLPEGISELDLSNNQFNNPSNFSVLGYLRPSITLLHLCDNNLADLGVAGLIGFLYAIPVHVDSVDLSGNDLLRQFKIPLLIELLNRLPPHIKLIKLSAGVPGYVTPARMIELLNVIPHTITSCHSVRIINAVTAIDLGERYADLSENELGSEKSDNLATFLSRVTPTLDYLNLSDNDLGGTPGSGLALVFNAIHKQLSRLNLSSNNLYCKGGYKLAEAFKCLPELYLLDLSDNNFGRKYIYELYQAFSTLPSCLKELNLSWNNFYMMEPLSLGKAISALPRGLRMLDLSWNHLDEYTTAELKEIFSNLPAGLTMLDLRGNGLEEKFGQSFYELFILIPPSVTHIAYDERAFIDRAPPIAVGAGKGPSFFADDTDALAWISDGDCRSISLGSG